MAQKQAATAGNKGVSGLFAASQRSDSQWSAASLWQQMIVAQHQWLLEWWLGLLAGAMQPRRINRAASPTDFQRIGFARRQLGCIGAADLTEAGASRGDQTGVTDNPAAGNMSRATGGNAKRRRSRRVPEPTPK